MRRFGTEVVLIEPTAEDHAVMGRNLMSAERRQDVIETAERTVAEQLRDPELRARLSRAAEGRATQDQPARGPAVELARDPPRGQTGGMTTETSPRVVQRVRARGGRARRGRGGKRLVVDRADGWRA